MALFKGRSSLLEVQNRALMKTAKERAAQIDRLERELQGHDGEQVDKLGRELQVLQARAERQSEEIKRLTLERDFYSKKASTLEEENRQLTECAIKYSEHAQKPELRAQKLERELNRIDPDGAPGRRFDAEETT